MFSFFECRARYFFFFFLGGGGGGGGEVYGSLWGGGGGGGGGGGAAARFMGLCLLYRLRCPGDLLDNIQGKTFGTFANCVWFF